MASGAKATVGCESACTGAVEPDWLDPGCDKSFVDWLSFTTDAVVSATGCFGVVNDEDGLDCAGTVVLSKIGAGAGETVGAVGVVESVDGLTAAGAAAEFGGPGLMTRPFGLVPAAGTGVLPFSASATPGGYMTFLNGRAVGV